MKPIFAKLFLALFAFGALASNAVAAELTLDLGRAYSTGWSNGGMGSGRGLGFHADENFSINSFAIDLSVPGAETSPQYTFEIFDSTDGHTAGQLLASTNFYLTEGEGYQLQPLVFSFVAGNFYVINFSRVDGQHLGQLGTHYSWEDVGTFVPYDYGVLTLLEGYEGADPNPSNPLIPWVQFSDVQISVPEPVSVPALSQWALIALIMLFGVVLLTRKKRLF